MSNARIEAPESQQAPLYLFKNNAVVSRLQALIFFVRIVSYRVVIAAVLNPDQPHRNNRIVLLSQPWLPIRINTCDSDAQHCSAHCILLRPLQSSTFWRH